MNSNNKIESENQKSLQRLQRISDGIFMLAMTLMVLQFDLPDLHQEMSATQVKDFLLDQLPALSIYLGTFILIAFYWLSNLDQFKYYKKTDGIHLWLNLFSLMFVVIIPYSNDLANVYPLNSSVQIFYSINLVCVGLFSCLSWWYASNNKRLLITDVDNKTIKYIGLESLIEPIISLLSIVVSLIDPVYWEWSFFLIIPLYILLNNQKEN